MPKKLMQIIQLWFLVKESLLTPTLSERTPVIEFFEEIPAGDFAHVPVKMFLRTKDEDFHRMSELLHQSKKDTCPEPITALDTTEIEDKEWLPVYNCSFGKFGNKSYIVEQAGAPVSCVKDIFRQKCTSLLNKDDRGTPWPTIVCAMFGIMVAAVICLDDRKMRIDPPSEPLTGPGNTQEPVDCNGTGSESKSGDKAAAVRSPQTELFNKKPQSYGSTNNGNGDTACNPLLPAMHQIDP